MIEVRGGVMRDMIQIEGTEIMIEGKEITIEETAEGMIGGTIGEISIGMVDLKGKEKSFQLLEVEDHLKADRPQEINQGQMMMSQAKRKR